MKSIGKSRQAARSAGGFGPRLGDPSRIGKSPTCPPGSWCCSSRSHRLGCRTLPNHSSSSSTA